MIGRDSKFTYIDGSHPKGIPMRVTEGCASGGDPAARSFSSGF
jgi:hypothetical protein